MDPVKAPWPFLFSSTGHRRSHSPRRERLRTAQNASITVSRTRSNKENQALQLSSEDKVGTHKVGFSLPSHKLVLETSVHLIILRPTGLTSRKPCGHKPQTLELMATRPNVSPRALSLTSPSHILNLRNDDHETERLRHRSVPAHRSGEATIDRTSESNHRPTAVG